MMKSVASLSTGSVLAQLIQFIIFILLARFLGPAGFGHFSVALVIANLLVVCIDFGKSTSFTKDLAFGKLSPESFQRQLSARTSILGLTAVLFLAVSIYLSDPYVAGIALIVFTQTTFMASQSSLKSELAVGRLSASLVSDRLICFVLVLVASIFSALTPTIALFAWSFGQIVAVLVIFLRKTNFNWRFQTTDIREAFDLKRTFHLGVFSVTNLATSLDQLIIKAISGLSSLGTYAAVSKWFVPLQFISNAFSTVLINNLAANKTNINSKDTRRMWLSLSILGLLVIAGSFACKDFARLILGPGYGSVSILFPILGASASVILFNLPLAQLLQYFGKDKQVALVTVLAGIGYLGALAMTLLFDAADAAAKTAIIQLAMQSVILISFLVLYQRVSKNKNLNSHPQ